MLGIRIIFAYSFRVWNILAAMPDPTFRQLRSFLTVVETGSVSAAARLLNLTQPALSQQLREVERMLGARLLNRARGKITPTATGYALLGLARRAQTVMEDIAAAIVAHRSGDRGRVRLGTGATACIYILPPVLSAVKRTMPRLEIIIVTGNTLDILQRVEAGNLDLALVTLPATIERSLMATRVCLDPLTAVVPKAMAPDSLGMEPRQLAQLPLILYEADGATRDIVDAWFRHAGLKPHPIMELGNVEAIKGLVASGLGASILPQLAVSGGVQDAVLRSLRPVVQRPLGVVLRRDKIVDRGLRVLLDEISRSHVLERPVSAATESIFRRSTSRLRSAIPGTR